MPVPKQMTTGRWECCTARGRAMRESPPVLLEGYLYVMFIPAFFTIKLCWWLFHNLPHLWDANFAPPEDWRRGRSDGKLSEVRRGGSNLDCGRRCLVV